ncbi:MAG: yqkA [Symbiobacteriaceae bacterium]|jgi:probable phosphoglycerate mutase|nr:yqkA [Symbiobacteriaceae bacterium]
MEIHLVRHGHDGDGFRGGWSPAGLSPQGRAQANALAARLRSEGWQIDTLLTSDLPRAVQTAAAVADALGLPLPTPAPQWRETNNGLLAGMANVDVEARWPGLYWRTLAMDEPYPGGGESPNAFFLRIKAAWEQLCADVDAGRIGPQVAVVTHAGAIDVVGALVTGGAYSNRGRGFPAGYTTIYSFERQGDRWAMVRQNDHTHLDDALRDQVELVDYDPRWPVACEDERRRIAAALGVAIETVEHVGSTAIPSMPAKPVLDIMVGVEHRELTAEQLTAMAKLGYEARGERSGVEGRLFFRKGNPRTHHVHMVPHGGELWQNYLRFRDFLRTHPADAARYAALKRDLASAFAHERPRYTESKAPFIAEILERARAAGAALQPDIDVRLGSTQFAVRVGAIFLHEGHVLLHQSDADVLWCLPGGRARAMESSAEAVRREMAEELSADVEVGPMQWVLENFFAYGGRTWHELGLYHLCSFTDRAWYDLTRTYVGSENGTLKLTFRWHPIARVDEVRGLVPKALYQALKALPQGLTHITNNDLA